MQKLADTEYFKYLQSKYKIRGCDVCGLRARYFTDYGKYCEGHYTEMLEEGSQQEFICND